MEKLYTVEDVAQMTGLTSRTIRNYLADGRLTGRKVGAQWRFTEENISAIFTEASATRKSVSAKAASAEVDAFLKPQSRDAVSVCAVVDYPAESADAVAALVQKLTDQYYGFAGSSLRFIDDYDEQNGVARFTIIGEINQVAKMIKTIRKE